MHPSDFDLHYHELVFSLRCHERTGAAFQQFFEEIMVRYDHTFTPVKTHGNQGDWKNDGWISSSGTVFQCYSPESTEATKIIAKINEDFTGALTKWAGKMRAWTLVWLPFCNLKMRVPCGFFIHFSHIDSDRRIGTAAGRVFLFPCG